MLDYIALVAVSALGIFIIAFIGCIVLTILESFLNHLTKKGGDHDLTD